MKKEIGTAYLEVSFAIGNRKTSVQKDPGGNSLSSVPEALVPEWSKQGIRLSVLRCRAFIDDESSDGFSHGIVWTGRLPHRKIFPKNILIWVNPHEVPYAVWVDEGDEEDEDDYDDDDDDDAYLMNMKYSCLCMSRHFTWHLYTKV